jgi:hypothetical protein
MPLFNRRNKAGSGEGEQVHIGHTDPFAGPVPANPFPAAHDAPSHKDPFNPPRSSGVSLEQMAHRAKVTDALNAQQGKYRPDRFA